MYKSKVFLYSTCLLLLFQALSCSRANRYSRHTTYGQERGRTVLKNDPLALSLSFPADYKIESNVPYQEYRTARKLLPNKFPVKYRYLLYKAKAAESDLTHYSWRIPANRINITELAQLPQWEKKSRLLYAVDSASVPATALMVAIYPGQDAHYVFLIKAEAEKEQTLPAVTAEMKEEAFEILEQLQTQ